MKSDDTEVQPEWPKVIIPVIRNWSLNTTANDIINVQPMVRPKLIQIGFTDGIEHPYWADIPNSVGAIFNIKAFDEKHKEQTDWCLKTFNEEDWTSSSFKFYFRNEKDRDWFVLRWS